MTLNLSGGREPRLSWGISSANPNEFLGELANDPAVANLLKNSSYPISLSPAGNGEAIKVNGGSIEHRRSPFSADDLLNTTTQCEGRGDLSRTTTYGTTGSPRLVEADCARTLEITRKSNGWTSTARYVGGYY